VKASEDIDGQAGQPQDRVDWRILWHSRQWKRRIMFYLADRTATQYDRLLA